MAIFDFLKKKPNPSAPQQPRPVAVIPGYAIAQKCDLSFDVIKSITNKFIAIDFETTGLSPETDRIIEIGAVIFVNGIPVDKYSILVNPGIYIPIDATAVNHITNEMVANAPDERAVFEFFVGFLGDALDRQTYMCAHNASFDFAFLCNTLSRLGYNANILYLDTLSISRRLIKGLDNYKQGTVERYFGLSNQAAHRAVTDAEICGEILCRLRVLAENAVKEKKPQIENNPPSDDELEVCAVIQRILRDAGADTSCLGFRKNSSGYIEAACIYSFLKFKFAKKGKYLILKKEAAATETQLPCEHCTATEGGTDFVRIYFSKPTEIESYKAFILREYESAYKLYQGYMQYEPNSAQELQNWRRINTTLSDEAVNKLCCEIDEKQYESVEGPKSNLIITREMVTVDAVHHRCPLSEIKSSGKRNYDAGYECYERGERARKEDRLEEALALFDEARYLGYDAPELYDSYAVAFHKMKDYDNEIVIIEEFLTRKTYGKAGQFEARLSSALKSLYTRQEAERKATEKALEKERKLREKEERVQKEKTPRGRAICQMDDEGNIVAEYESLTQAVYAIGVSAKSIRDAANGVQKHAGGYCWKYKNQSEESPN